MTDLIALKAALETDARYDAAVRAGKNRDLLSLLDDPEPGETQFLVVPSGDVLEAIGDGLRAATARELIGLFTARDTVDFTKVATRTEVREALQSSPDAQTRLDAVMSRPRTYGEAFTDEEAIILRDLWAVLKDIPKSAMATRQVADDAKAAANETTIATLQAAIQAADPSLGVSDARSQAIREMYETEVEA